MNLILTICGGVAALIATLLMWWQSRVGHQMAIMAGMQPTKASDAGKTAPGTLVELIGQFTCAAPLVSEFARQACVYYKAKIEREYVTTSRDSNGNSQRRTERQIVQNNERNAPCALTDASGAVNVNFAGATVEAMEICNRYVAGGDAGLLNVAGALLGVSGSTTGHYYIETIIPPAVPIYLLGTVQPDGSIGASTVKDHPFIISYKSKEQRAKDLNSSRHWIEGGAVVCFFIAAGLFVWAFMKGH